MINNILPYPFYNHYYTIVVRDSAAGTVGEQLSTLDLCALLKKDESRSALKRLIEGGGVWVNNERITDAYALLRLERLVKIRIGKRGFFEVV